MFINSMNREIRNDIFYDMIPFVNLRKNFWLLGDKIDLFLLEKEILSEWPHRSRKDWLISRTNHDLRDKSIARLILLSPLFHLGLHLTGLFMSSATGILTLPIPGITLLGATALAVGSYLAVAVTCQLIVAIYDIAYRIFYNKEYILDEIKDDHEFFNKADPELRTNLEFILKAMKRNPDVSRLFPKNFFLDPTFLQIVTKKKLAITDDKLHDKQQLINRFYYDALRTESKPEDASKLEVTGETFFMEKLPNDTLREIINWLGIASSTRFLMTSKKITVLIEPVLTLKVNAFFKHEVNHLIKAIKIYDSLFRATFFDLIGSDVFKNNLKHHITQFEDGNLSEATSYLGIPIFFEVVKKLSEMQDSDFKCLPQEANITNFNRIERIKSSILFAFKGTESFIYWKSDHSLLMRRSQLSYLALEVVS